MVFRRNSCAIPRVAQKGSWEGGDSFGQKEDTGGIILGDNPAGHYFVLDDLVSRRLSYFRKSYACVTENARRRQKNS